MSHIAIVCLATIAVLVDAAPAPAAILQHVAYYPDSLPSEQGWVYRGDLEEAAYASLGDGVLVLDSMPNNPGYSGTGYYTRELEDHPDARFLSWNIRVRVLEQENENWPWHDGFGTMGYYWPGFFYYGTMFGIAQDHVWVTGDAVADMDGAQWCDYAFVIDLDDVAAGVELSIDGVMKGSFLTNDPLVRGAMVRVGDMSDDSNARVEISSIDIFVSGDAPVPAEAVTFSDVRELFR